MKLIEKKEQQVTPELIWGAKYKLLTDTEDIPAGAIVILVEAEVDSDGDLKVYSEDNWDYVKPEYLQLITEPSETKLVKGNQYLASGKSWGGTDLTGKTVTLIIAEPDEDNDVKVSTVDGPAMWVKPEQLKELPVEPVTFTIEFTEEELGFIYASVGTSNNSKRRGLLSGEGFCFADKLKGFDDTKIYRELREILQGADK